MVRRARDMPELRTDPVPWNPGEHVAIIGTTGTGKSYLMSRVVAMRRFVAIFQTKFDDIKYPGYKTVTSEKPLANLKVTDSVGRFRIVPEFNHQASVGHNLFRQVWLSGGWTLVVDELYYAHQILRLEKMVAMLMTQGRSKRISMVTGMQRPVSVTRFALSEATHVFAFRLEGRDAKIISDVAGDDFAYVSTKIPKYHFAHYHVPTRSVAVGTADKLDRILISSPVSRRETTETKG